MEALDESWIVGRAEAHFREFERFLIDLGFVRSKVRQAMRSQASLYRRQIRGVKLVLYQDARPPEREVTALRWGELQRPPLWESGAHVMVRKWRRHLPGELTRARIRALGARDYEDHLWGFDERAKALNASHRDLSLAIRSIEKTLLLRGKRRDWESGDLETPVPLVSLALREQSRKALGAGWFFLLRMVAAEAELMKIIERYQAEPAHPDWSMEFRQHQGCRYGRVRWLHGDTLLPATDSGSIALTHRRLREFGVPKREFAALLVHERARRRMTSVHAPYVKAMGRIRTQVRKALSSVDERLRHQDLCGTAALQV